MWNRKTLLRLISIQRVLVRHGLNEMITTIHFFRPLRFVFYLFPKAKDIGVAESLSNVNVSDHAAVCFDRVVAVSGEPVQTDSVRNGL